jgi:uncharacterized protein (DUF58 family)
MQKFQMLIILILITLIASLAVYHYLFSIYEVEVKVNPKNIYSGKSSEVTISVIPINAIGKRALYRKVYANFDIIEGKNLAEIVLEDRNDGKLILRIKGEAGKVVVKVKSEYALLPSEIEIPILPNLAANIKF